MLTLRNKSVPVLFVAITNQRCISWPRKKSLGRNGWIGHSFIHGARCESWRPGVAECPGRGHDHGAPRGVPAVPGPRSMQ